MSSIVDDILEHHGVKGMKWGERRAEKKFVGRVTNPRKRANFQIELHNATNAAMNHNHIPRINAKPVYVKAANDGTLRNDLHPTTKKYVAEYMKAYEGELNKEAAKLGTSPSGKRYVVHMGDDFLGFTVSLKDAKHADSELFKVEFVKDDQGRVTGFKLVTTSLAQSALIVGDILEHHGIKGMKWGVRRKATVEPKEVIVRDSRIGKGVRTTGGSGHPISSDAARARTIGQIGKKSGLKALSDQELQDYTRRLNLEQNVKRLNYADASPPKKFVMHLLGQTGKSTAHSVANDVASQQVKKHLYKKIGMAAVAAA